MPLSSLLPFAAAGLSLLLALAGLLPRQRERSIATWCFVAGMVILAIDSLLTGVALRADETVEALEWLVLGLVAKSFIPAAWLPFSLAYSRGDYRDTLKRWAIPLAILAVLPAALALGFREQLVGLVPVGPDADLVQLRFGPAGKALNVLLLVALVLVLANLEQTLRSAVGTMRWRIKFVVLGLAVVFGAHLYVRSEAILFSAYQPGLSGVESSGLLVGCLLLALAYARTGLAEIDVYPSRAVLRSSLTVLIVGGYLFVIGVLAQVVRRFGGAESFQLQALVVLLGMAGLAALLLSDRLRQRIQAFVGRHFRKAQHDSVRIWTGLSRRLGDVRDQPGLCAASARLVSETFEILSVTIWLLDEQRERFARCASTGAQAGAEDAWLAGWPGAGPGPFDFDEVSEPWAREWRQANPSKFPNGGHRWLVPLRAGESCVGALVLADRVNGAPYTAEELALLRCIADQVTSALLNLRLGDEVARARELDAFRTMSAFFVHDLKNAAASLNLMLKNLPAHFDDPAFREDALRAVGNAARRIDETIARLSALRQRPELQLVEADLNRLVGEALEGIGETPGVELTKELGEVPAIRADRDQLRSVVANLVLNARDAVCGERAEARAGRTVAAPGHVVIRTERRGSRVALSVADDGCGMSAEFMSQSLFKPFRSTKQKGLGIGMFQSRMIVEAHGGSMQVESEAGQGTTVRVSLPAGNPR